MLHARQVDTVSRHMESSIMSYRPPETYEELIKLIHDRYDDMSKSYQKIALYLTQNPNDVAVLSVNAIGQRCGIHASRNCRGCSSAA